MGCRGLKMGGMRAVAPLLLGGTALGITPLWSEAQAQERAASKTFDIPAQPLGDAVTELGRQGRVQITAETGLLAGRQSSAVSGRFAATEALSRLLTGTGLTWRWIDKNTVALERALQSSDGAIQLGPVRVEGNGGNSIATSGQLGAPFSAATSEGTRSYAARAVTIGKSELALKDIPQSVTVLTRQRMDDQNVISIGDALESVAGITLQRGPGPGLFVNSRGFEINMLQYDGVPTPRNLYSAGSYLVDSMAFYDRVEVLRGAAGLLQGANAPGGAVNFVRKRGQSDLTINASAIAGSWNHFGAQFDVGGPVDAAGHLRVRTVADYDQSDSFVDYVWSKARSLYFAVDYDLTPDTVIGFGVSNRHSRGRPNERGIMRYADGGDLGLSRSTFSGADWNRTQNDQTTYYADIEHRFSDAWKVKIAALHRDEHSRANYQFISGTISRTTLAGARYSDFATDFNPKGNAIDGYVEGRFSTLGMENTIVLGANHLSYKTDDILARQFNVENVDIFNIRHDRARQTVDSLADNAFSSRSAYDVKQTGIYGSWRLKPVEALTISLGGRVSWYDYAYRSRNGTARAYGAESVSTSEENGNFTPYVGAVYAVNRNWNVYASYASIFEPQTARDRSGILLKPVTGANYEAGIKGELAGGAANVSLAIFRYDHKNRAFNDVSGGFACDGWYCSVASGRVRSQGVELEASGELLPGLQLAAGYTFNTTEYLEDPTYTGQRFALATPKHLVRITVNYTLPGDLDRFSLGGGVKAQSSSISLDRVFDLPGFAIFDARIGYKVNDNVTVALKVDNLLDKRYYLPGYGSVSVNNFLGDPRNFALTVRGRF